MVLFRLFALMCRFGAVAGVFVLCVVLACWCLLSWFVVLVWLGGLFVDSLIVKHLGAVGLVWSLCLFVCGCFVLLVLRWLFWLSGLLCLLMLVVRVVDLVCIVAVCAV